MATSATPSETVAAEGDGVWAGYAPEHERPPLGTYALLSSGFTATLGAFVFAQRRNSDLPEIIPTRDLALMGAAAFKLSRLLTKEKVAAFMRAPFTEYQGKGEAPGEVEEKARGTGPRAAVGQLFTCPYCIGMWIVSAFTVGLVTAPRETRLVTSLLSALGLSDFLQVGYQALVARREPS